MFYHYQLNPSESNTNQYSSGKPIKPEPVELHEVPFSESMRQNTKNASAAPSVKLEPERSDPGRVVGHNK